MGPSNQRRKGKAVEESAPQCIELVKLILLINTWSMFLIFTHLCITNKRMEQSRLFTNHSHT